MLYIILIIIIVFLCIIIVIKENKQKINIEPNSNSNTENNTENIIKSENFKFIKDKKYISVLDGISYNIEIVNERLDDRMLVNGVDCTPSFHTGRFTTGYYSSVEGLKSWTKQAIENYNKRKRNNEEIIKWNGELN